jgi:hypothetical protein
MRFAVLAGICVVVAAGCGGGGGRVLTLRSTEDAVRSAGYGSLRVIDASRAVARLRSEGVDVAGLQAGTPDYIIPRGVPVVSVLRFTSTGRAKRVRNKEYTARVCNVVVYNAAPGIEVAQRGAARIVAALRKRCR